MSLADTLGRGLLVVNSVNVRRFLSRTLGNQREWLESGIGYLNTRLQKRLTAHIVCTFTAG